MSEDQERLIRQWRKGIKSCQFVLLPDGREFMIMWRQFDQFGVRNLESGEQYAFTYEDALKHKLVPLILCPMDMSQVEL